VFRTIEISDKRFAFEGLHFVTVKSEALRHRADLTVYVPPGLKSIQKVPLVILLHGVYGSHWAWALKGGAHRTADKLILDGVIRPMVLVMPSDGLWGDGSGYVSHGEADYERWIVDEVPVAAKMVAEVTADSGPVFIAGLSMGGFGALRLAAKYPNRFSAASAHSSAITVGELTSYIKEPLTSWSHAPEDRSVLSALIGAKAGLPPFRFDCGTEDALLDSNRKLHRELLSLDIPHVYEEFPGGHDWNYWERHLADSLRFFAST
jgi:enterochelin esterase-like enzyme